MAIINPKTVCNTASIVATVHLTVIMLLYGGDAYKSFGVGRISPDEGRRLLTAVFVNDSGNDGSDDNVHQRLVMAILINFRINIMAWTAMWLTSIYSVLRVNYADRTLMYLLTTLAYFNTLTLHVWHMSGSGEPLVPASDPYHTVPTVLDSIVFAFNLVAFMMVRSQREHDKTD